jgi:hypothetical protein
MRAARGDRRGGAQAGTSGTADARFLDQKASETLDSIHLRKEMRHKYGFVEEPASGVFVI